MKDKELDELFKNKDFWRELAETHRSKKHLRASTVQLSETGLTELEKKLREEFNKKLK